jgi:hypothetical protein
LTQVSSVKNKEMRIAVDAGGPFAAEEGPVGGINLLLEGLRQAAQLIRVEADAILNPKIAVIGDEVQGGLDLKTLVGIAVGYPKSLLSPKTLGWGGGACNNKPSA